MIENFPKVHAPISHHYQSPNTPKFQDSKKLLEWSREPEKKLFWELKILQTKRFRRTISTIFTKKWALKKQIDKKRDWEN